MSVKVRLQRGGRVSLPIYSIVVADSRSARDKQFIERLGFWAPKAKGAEVPFKLNEERLNHLVGVGAQVTDVVARLLIKQNVGPAKVRDAFAKIKARRISAAGAIAKQKAADEARKAKAEAKKAGADAAPAEEAAPVAAAPVVEAAVAPVEAPAAEPVAAAPSADAPAEETPAA